MDELSMIIVVANISMLLFIFLNVFIYNYTEKRKFTYIRLSSGFYALSTSFFYFDIKRLLDGNPSILWTFFTFLFFMLSLSFFAKSITQLYNIKSLLPIKFHALSAVFLASLITYATMSDLFLLRVAIFTVGILVPLMIVIYYQSKVVNIKLFNIISAQILLIIFFFIAAFIIFLLKMEPLSFTDSPNYIKILVMFVDLILGTIIFSFVLEKSSMDIKDLNGKNQLLENMFNKVKVLSETDELTSCYNRRKITDIMELYKNNFDNNNIVFSVLMIDVNNFKDINDTFGHVTGDEVLVHTAKYITNSLRSSDYVGRWGGDEFLIVLENTDIEAAEQVKTKLFTREVTCNDIPLSYSVGCAQIQVDQTIESLISSADSKMYKEKNKYKKKI